MNFNLHRTRGHGYSVTESKLKPLRDLIWQEMQTLKYILVDIKVC